MNPPLAALTSGSGRSAINKVGRLACSARGFPTCCVADFPTHRRTKVLPAIRSTAACRFGNRRYVRLGNLRFNFATNAVRALRFWLLLGALTAIVGCGTGKTARQKNEFFTSGSREADQRASQRMAKSEQLAGSGEGTGEKKVKEPKPSGEAGPGETNAAQAEGKLALFERLGGEKGLTAIIEDATPRLLQDPQVNWQRKGTKRGGLFSHHNGSESAMWEATADNIANLKKHLVQFLALATGGPAHYDAKQMKATHSEMHISNPEFDAAIGDIKASLDKLRIRNVHLAMSGFHFLGVIVSR